MDGKVAERVHVNFMLQQDADGYPPVSSEEVDAERAGVNLFRLTGIPIFAYGVAPGDLVKGGLGRDGNIWITEVVEPANHWVARVVPLDATSADSPLLGLLSKQFEQWGCLTQISSFGIVALDVPPFLDNGRIVQILERGRASGEWDFDLGVAPGAVGVI